MDQPGVPFTTASTARRVGLRAAPFGVAVTGILSIYFDAGARREYLDEQIALLPERFFLPDGDGPLQIRAVE